MTQHADRIALRRPRVRALLALCVAAASTSAVMSTQLARAQSPSLVDSAGLEMPAQDQGLPYTRSARRMALERIRDCIALFPGSRYAYVFGHRTRLDSQRLLSGEAVVVDGVVYVPEDFAPVVLTPRAAPVSPAPEYLTDKWVYSFARDAGARLPAGIARKVVDGAAYVSIDDLARAAGKSINHHPTGLVTLGDGTVTLAGVTEAHLDSLVTLFDTPDKFAAPGIATRWIPILRRQGAWTDHVKVTPEQLAMLEGPEIISPGVPDSEFDLTGFDRSRLGSSVPAPGVYPRVLFSPQDVPEIARRIRESKYGQMSLIEQEVLFRQSWWDPSTSDGAVFLKLASGDLEGLEWIDDTPGMLPSAVPHLFAGQKPGIFSTHVAYIPECLTAMALWCLVNDDDQRGRQVAAAVANYYRLRERLVDEWNQYSDSEFGGSAVRPNGQTAAFHGNGGETHWRGMHGVVAHMNLGLSLDFAGKWMTDAEKDDMRRIIAKATYGRRPYGADGPVRFRDVNWCTWDLPHFLALCAIEGLEGFDQEGYEQNRRTIRAFLDFGIDRSGQMWESNGKSGGGLQFQLLSMAALARRGENLWGHPHLRKMLEAQVQCTMPNGELTVSSGSFSGAALSDQAVNLIRAFYPQDRCADYLLTLGAPGEAPPLRQPWEPRAGVALAEFDAAAYRAKLEAPKGTHRLRLPSVSYPGFVRTVLYDNDWQTTDRQSLNLPLDWTSQAQGMFSSGSDSTPQATWLNLHVRPNHYMGAGHHHSDAGMFQFSALGVNWVTESPFYMEYRGKYHNQVIIDGESQPGQFPSRAHYLGANLQQSGASAAADLTYAYSYRWTTQPPQEWPTDADTNRWELEPAGDIVALYQGTGRYKMRPWWPSYTFSNPLAASRAPFNTVEFAYRSVGLIRGNHPYAIVVDDVKKDAQTRLYQWTAMLGPGVWKADVDGAPQGAAVLSFDRSAATVALSADQPAKAIMPDDGDPLVVVVPVSPFDSGDPSLAVTAVETLWGPPDRKGNPVGYSRLSVNRRGEQAAFRVLLIPMRAGEPWPEINVDQQTVTITIGGQTDTVRFRKDGSRTRFTVEREGQIVVEGR